MTTLLEQRGVTFEALKARQKATWESGDFGQIAKHIARTAEEFIGRLPLKSGMRVLDAACGTGNLAVVAARKGCEVSGVDIASNLIEQARLRAAIDRLPIDYREGDVEALPYEDESFDAIVSMFGIMFAPRPDLVVNELCRVTRPGGLIALANWTPEGFVGEMFKVVSLHVPPPAGVPSPLLWGDETSVRERFGSRVRNLKLNRRMARMHFPFSPAGTVKYFRTYFGPTLRAFASLSPQQRPALEADLERLQSRHNVSTLPQETENLAEYLEVQTTKA